ncbi:MAG: nicotinate phosphoribosyltransferase [Phycisphaerae bacterium]|nr:nicotinate phosphoribosyltransferase [Phycisphaerae bacterium]
MTDLYQLTMAAGYFHNGLHERRACFEAFVRGLPPNRSYLIAAGLEQVLHYLTNLRFTDEQVGWLKDQAPFQGISPAFFEYLRQMRFACDVWAMPEGSVFFPGEPILRITGDLIQSQLVETYVLTCLTIQVLVASKAARIVWAARGRPVVDFGARRAHGPMAGLLAARAALIGGCAGTSLVEAARRLGVRAVGTQAHSWVMSFEDEQEAFLRYADLFGPHTVCLIDTYDTIAGARKAVAVGKDLSGVRLDSGDLVSLSKQVRQVLDEAGLRHTKIVASGDLNEFRIAELLDRGAPIDLFGVGTEMVTSHDAPALSLVYKLVESEDKAGVMAPRIKQSAAKATLAGAKQVYRQYQASGAMTGDLLARDGEQASGAPLLAQVMRCGKLQMAAPGIQRLSDRARDQIAALPPELRELSSAAPYSVTVSEALRSLQPNGSDLSVE